MRRAIVTACLSVLCLLAIPESADAWFWRWVDDLSGPQFQGFSFDLKVWCSPQGTNARRSMLDEVKQRLQAEQRVYRRRAITSSGREAFFYWLATAWTALAVEAVDTGIQEPASYIWPTLEQAEGPRDHADIALKRAVHYRDLAVASAEARVRSHLRPPKDEEITEWLLLVDKVAGDPDSALNESQAVTVVREFRDARDLEERWERENDARVQQLAQQLEYQTLAVTAPLEFSRLVHAMAFSPAPLPVAGVSASACDFSYYDVDRFFVYASGSYGWDVKRENRGRDLKLLTAGGSFHWVVVPAITVGAGGGVGMFLTRSRFGDFPKGYLHAPIIDLKPLTVFLWNPRFRTPWAHTLYLRYSGVIFPGGFGPNRFYEGSPDYSDTEYIHSAGIYFDAEPLFRNWRGKWWRNKP